MDGNRWDQGETGEMHGREICFTYAVHVEPTVALATEGSSAVLEAVGDALHIMTCDIRECSDRMRTNGFKLKEGKLD